MKLETKRLILRPLSLEDKDDLFEYRSDSETNRYQGWIPKTMEDVEVFIGKISKEINERGTWFQLAIIEKESQKMIGDLGIHFIDSEDKQVELGCTLNKDFQNMGFATEALIRVIDYLFRDLNKHRITTSIDPANKSSIRLVERIGFRKEAHFVQPLSVKGEWVDDLVYALIEKEWDIVNAR